MNLMNILIVSLFVINLILIKNNRSPNIKKVLPWIIVILFSFQWSVGGFIQYPLLANAAGIIVIIFWLIVISFSIPKLLMRFKADS